MNSEDDDRPTIPQVFDIDAERFFAAREAPEGPVVLDLDEDDEVIHWWLTQRRKAFAAWVAAIVAACGALLVAGVLTT